MDDTIFYFTAQSGPLPVDLDGAGHSAASSLQLVLTTFSVFSLNWKVRECQEKLSV